MIKAAIFDMGGVVLSPRTLASIKKRFAKKLEVSNKKFRKSFSFWFTKWKLGKITETQAWRGILDDLGRKYVLDYFKKEIRKQKINKSVIKILKGLKKEGIKVALLSNTTKEWFAFNRKRFGFDKLFDVIVVSFEEGTAKPSLKIYKRAVTRLKVRPSECIFIDDKKRNVDIAKKLGMRGIVYSSAKSLRKGLRIETKKHGKKV